MFVLLVLYKIADDAKTVKIRCDVHYCFRNCLKKWEYFMIF